MGLAQGVWKVPISPWAYAAVILFFLGLAFYRAWLKERQRHEYENGNSETTIQRPPVTPGMEKTEAVRDRGSPETEKQTNVQLTPSQGQSERMLLAVQNLGPKQRFRAQCRIMDRRNDPNPPRKVTVNLGWEVEGIKDMTILFHESRNLVIAGAGYDPIAGIEWMNILGVSEQPESRWTRGQKENLPEYDLEIRVFGDKSDRPHVEQFTVRPGIHTALEMFKLNQLAEKMGSVKQGYNDADLEISFEPMPPCQIEESAGKITVYRLRVCNASRLLSIGTVNGQFCRIHPLPRDQVFRKRFPYSLYLSTGEAQCVLNPKQEAFIEFATSWIAASDGCLRVGVMDSVKYREHWPVAIESSELWYLTLKVSAANIRGKEVVLSFQPEGEKLHVELVEVKQLS